MKTLLLITTLLLAQTIFGQEWILTDPRDQKAYKVFTFLSDFWMAQNLDVSIFRNGDSIPEAKTEEEWEAAGNNEQPAWCYYNNDSKRYGAAHGKLYNWYAVNDPRGLAPEGYHIPTNTEWETMMRIYGDNAWRKLLNKNGLSCLGSGWRTSGYDFSGITEEAHYWSSTEVENTDDAYNCYINVTYRENFSGNGDVSLTSSWKKYGMSVRCISKQ